MYTSLWIYNDIIYNDIIGKIAICENNLSTKFTVL